jgi:hypothetical protein
MWINQVGADDYGKKNRMSNTGGAMTEAEKIAAKELQVALAKQQCNYCGKNGLCFSGECSCEDTASQGDVAQVKVTETWRVERLVLGGWVRYMHFNESEQDAREFFANERTIPIGFRVIHVTTTERIVATRTREETHE